MLPRLLGILASLGLVLANTPPIIVKDMSGLVITSDTLPGTVVYRLEAVDVETAVFYSLGNAGDLLSVDAESGAVTLLRSLSERDPEVLDVVVTAIDLPVGNQPPMTASKAVHVNLEMRQSLKGVEVNPSAPYFSAATDSVEIGEDWAPELPLPFPKPLTVHLPNKMKSSSVQLFVLSRNAKVAGAFLASPSVLQASKRAGEGLPFSLLVSDPSILNLEAADSPGNVLRIEVEALETDSGISTRLPIDVHIRDANDFGPEFGHAAYVFNATGSMMPGAVIGTLKVTDMDQGEYGEASLTYKLSGQHASSFEVRHGEKGMVELVVGPCEADDCRLASRVPESLPIVLQATDGGGRGNSAGLTIRVRSDDSRSPVFEAALYERSIVEQAPQFQPMLQLKATDLDGSKISYSLEDPSGLFKMEPATGILYPEYPKFLTLENVGATLELTAVASDGRNLPARTTVRITILEAEEKRNRAPVFDASHYSFKVGIGEKFVGVVSATDPEGNVSYSIAQGGGGLFAVDARSGAISFHGDTPMKSSNYTLEVLAVDESKEGRIGRTTVAVALAGLGSRPPKFIPKPAAVVSIRENALPGSLLYTFRAEDPDSDAYLVYKVLGVRAFNRYGHEESGEGVASGVQGAGPLESLVVFGGRGFTNGSLYLAKALPTELNILNLLVSVAVVDAAHADETQVVGSLSISVRPLSALEKLRKEPLTLAALGREVALAEDLPTGSFVLSSRLQPPLKAANKGEFKFRLLSGQPQLTIDEGTGDVRVGSSLDNVRMLNATVEVVHTPTARRAVQTTLIRVTPVNNHSPMFSQRAYSTRVSESAVLGSRVLRLAAVDADGDQVFFTLFGPDAASFSVDDDGWVLLESALDRETKATLSLFASAVDVERHVVSVPISIDVMDVNDNAPVLSRTRYSNEVMENSPLGSPLAFVSAADVDAGSNGTIEFSLIGFESAALKAALSIDPAEGVVTNVASLRGLHGEHSFGVVASDGGGLNAAAVVFLAIRPTYSCHPAFTAPSVNDSLLEVKENAAAGQVVVRFAAKTMDPSCGVSFALWDPEMGNYTDELSPFAIDAHTGVLRTTEPLDAEETSVHSVLIGAHSQSLFAQTRVLVRALDENDNGPAFAVRGRRLGLREDVPAEAEVAVFRAEDPDQGDNGQIFYHMVKDEEEAHWSALEYFQLDRNTGQLKLVSNRFPKRLDRESQTSLRFWVLASNEFAAPRLTATADVWRRGEELENVVGVWVDVLDVNDNGPVFKKANYSVAVPSHVPPGTFLAKVVAEDPDEGEGATGEPVMYRLGPIQYVYKGLRSTVAEALVVVDAGTGVVSVGGDLGPYVDGLLSAQVFSADSADPTLAQSHSAHLEVWIYDPSQLVSLVVKERPEFITSERAEEIVKAVGAKAGAEGILRSVGTHRRGSQSKVAEDRVDLQVLFLNRSAMVIIPTDEALGRLDAEGSWLRSPASGLGLVSVSAASSPSSSSSSSVGLGGATVGLVIFAGVLCLGLIGFGLLLCFFRYSFIREKKSLAVLAAEERRQKARAQPPLYLPSITSGLKENPLWGGSFGARGPAMITNGESRYEAQELSFPPPPPYATAHRRQQGPPSLRRQTTQSSGGTYATIERSVL